VFKRLRSLLPSEVWQSDEPSLRHAISAAIKPDQISDSFASVYRCFSLGKVVLKDQDYRIHDLTAGRPLDQVWKVESGAARIDPQTLAEGTVAVARYNLTTQPDVVLTADLLCPVDFATKFKRLDIAVRPDETWHAMNISIEVGGKLLRSV